MKKTRSENELENLVSEKLDNLIISEPAEIAEIVGLQYVCDGDDGYRRKRQGKGFIYLNSKGERVLDKKLISRFESLNIPPAWTSVWICSSPSGHIQATGRDAKGRKQYIYHTKWEGISNSNKFNLMIRFAESLPVIRARIDQDLKKLVLSREKVLAILVALLEETLIRIGNPEYVKQNGSFGLTTLRNKHLDITGSKIRFVFKGKSGKQWDIDIQNRRLARLVKKCQELPGQQLFQYIDDEGKLQSVGSGDVNSYLKEITGQEDFSAKDFRTWGGTILAARELYMLGPAESETDAKRKIVTTVKTVSHALNNTPSVCRKYYIHPEIISAFLEGSLFEQMDKATEMKDPSPNGLDPEETAVLNLLRLSLLEKETLLNSA